MAVELFGVELLAQRLMSFNHCDLTKTVRRDMDADLVRQPGIEYLQANPGPLANAQGLQGIAAEAVEVTGHIFPNDKHDKRALKSTPSKAQRKSASNLT